MLPTLFNSGRDVPRESLKRAVKEIVDHFGAASEEPGAVKGHWEHRGHVQHDSLSKIVVDVEDTGGNREWMREFKSRWKDQLDQSEIWLISYVIELE